MFETPLHLALSFGALGVGLELLALLMKSRSVRRVLYAGVFVLTVFSAVLLLGVDARLGTVLAALVAGYRAINAMRVITARAKDFRLGPASRRSSLFLILYQLIAIGIWRLAVMLEVTAGQVLYGLIIVSLAVGLGLVFVTRRNLRKTKLRPSDKYTADADLPTVSVCIPARNETDDLPACLEAVLANDYPKLEVLVLDDCSQDKTSEIIKGFAQKGVRFIRGEAPKTDWLAKNQAYEALAEAASGRLLLFMGVDVRLDKKAIRKLVGTLVARKKTMLSVLPRGLQTREHAGLIQPMRYWWELVLPRRLFHRPPVLSTLWMVERDALMKLGGFGSVRRSVLPEGYFARELAKRDGYSFMRSTGQLGVATAKKLPEQWDTALRTRYPQLRKRPENVLLLSVLQLWLLVLPLGLFIAGFFGVIDPLLWLLGGLNAVLLFAVHYQIVLAWGVRDSLPLIIFPAAVLAEIAGMHLSMWKYEFSEVIWKDRNICIPVMQQYKSLPRL